MITTVISYCSLDERFIVKNIEECLKFSNNVVIVYSDYFLDGTPDFKIKNFVENYKNEKVKFDYVKYDEEHDAKYWHNMFRYAGFKSVTDEYYLFLDADEIPNGDLFLKYLKLETYKNYDIIGDFICYYYFREPIYRSKTYSGVGLLIKSNYVKEQLFFHPQERWFYRRINPKTYSELNLPYPKIKEKESLTELNTEVTICDINGSLQQIKLGEIMFNHYSWVRTKEEMITKCNGWGHKTDKNWISLIEDEYSRPFNGKCFVHGWEYKEISNNLVMEN